MLTPDQLMHNSQLDDTVTLFVIDDPPLKLWARIDSEVNSFGLSLLMPYQLRHIGSYLHKNEEMAGGCNGLLVGSQFHITGLWIKSDIRHHGFGKKILQEAIMKANNIGGKIAFLDTENEYAKRMYADMGFVCLATIPGFIPGNLRSFFSRNI